jgi:hypothetical protein
VLLEDLRRCLPECMSDVFADLAFSDVEIPTEGEAPRPDEPCWASVRVSLPFDAEIALVLPATYLREIAAALLHEAADTASDALWLDVVAECTNTLAGRLAREEAGANSSIMLTVPERGLGWPDRPKADLEMGFVQESGYPLWVLVWLNP